MAKSTSPAQLTMKSLRANGGKCAIVEKWNKFGGVHGVRQDLFNIIDIIHLDPVRGVVGIQCCAGSGHKKHLEKLIIEHAQESLDWLSTPGTRLEIWSWSKRKAKRGGKAMIWIPRVEEITIMNIKEQ